MTPKKKIFFITQICFLDATIEYIDQLRHLYEIHLILQLTPNERKSNILNIDDDLQSYEYLVPFENVMRVWKLEFLEDYFELCRVHFVVYKHQYDIGDLLKGTKCIYEYCKVVKPDFVQLDDITVRQIFILPLLYQYRKKLVVNIHDPKLHSGESSKIRELARKVLYLFANKFVTFSEYSKGLLRVQLPKDKRIFSIKLLPYSVFKNFKRLDEPDPGNISFVGRISRYKGIELFMDAIKIVSEQHPGERFVVAGRPVFGYSINADKVPNSEIDIISKHLSNEEMTNLIVQSKLIVCPYLDATQSGVILTSYALCRPVIVTNVGGLPEYVSENETGLVARETTPSSLADAIIKFLTNNDFKRMSENLRNQSLTNRYKQDNLVTFPLIYI